jgi:hypothetical protein
MRLDLTSILQGALAGVATLGAASLTTWAAWRARHAERSQADADARARASTSPPADINESLARLSDSLSANTDKLIRELQSDRATLREECADLRQRVTQLERDNELCRADGRRMEEWAVALETELKRHNIEPPRRILSDTFTVVDKDGHATAIIKGPL